jgi:hypothetical protein
VDLLEREGALGALIDYAAEAHRGDARVVLVVGEPGTGKTTLLETLRDEHLTEARWLWAGCDDTSIPTPLQPVFDLARQVGAALAEAAAAGDRDGMFRAVLDELFRGPDPAVLVIEDVDSADEATLDLLRFLAAHIGRAHALVVLTCTDEVLHSEQPLRPLFAELENQRAVRRIDLPALSRAAVDRLADRAGADGAGVFALTNGNPFLVTEVLAAATTEAGLPAGDRAAVLARFSRLSPDARVALDAAAIAGRRAAVAVVRTVLAPADASIDECLAAGALFAEHGLLRFRHDIVRRAIEDAVPADLRAELHRRLLQGLQASGADEARLAHHADGAADRAAVLEFAPAAAAWALRLGAHREAVAQYQRAVRHAAATGSSTDSDPGGGPVALLPPGLAVWRVPVAQPTSAERAVRGHRAEILEQLGQWDEALRLAEQVTSDPAAVPDELFGPLGVVARIRTRRGDAGGLDAADELLWLAGDHTSHRVAAAAAHLVHAESAWFAGDLGSGALHAQVAMRLGSDTDPWVRGATATCARRFGVDDPIVGAVAPPYRLMLEGDLRGAARLLRGLGCSYDEALALSDTGAEAPLREALAILDRLGATAAISMVRAKLGALAGPEASACRRDVGRQPRHC